METLIEELTWRGLVQDIMPGTEDLLNKETVTGYVGFDPTADSLHIGNLVPIMLLVHLQRHGHKPLALVGGATGLVGDPSGKSTERTLMDRDIIQHNLKCQQKQLMHFLDFSDSNPNKAEIVNNYDWFSGFGFLQFIRDVGKHITINYMLSKDSVKTGWIKVCLLQNSAINSFKGMISIICIAIKAASYKWAALTSGAIL